MCGGEMALNVRIRTTLDVKTYTKGGGGGQGHLYLHVAICRAAKGLIAYIGTGP